MIAGLFSQETLGVGTPFWASIPISIQTLVGMVAIFGAGWTWFVRPRMVSIVVEAVARSSKELRAEMAAGTGELRKEMAAGTGELRREIAANRKELSGEIAANRMELSEEIAANRKEIAGNRKELSEEIAATRKELSEAIAGNRGEIATNRDSITAAREMISASRIETRDILAEIRRENHQAHEAIGGRISEVQMYVAQENATLRTGIAELKTDTAKLAGAVEVLTAVVRGGKDPGETWTP